MATYYVSACHDCETKVMWSKVTEEQAGKWHINYHKGHKTELSNDYDDDFYDRISGYKSQGIAIDGE